MLPERVVGKEDVFGRHVTDHVVRPVHHGGGHEGERPFPEGKRFSRFHADIAEVSVIGGKVFHARAGRGVNFRVFGDVFYERDRPAVVGFGMVGNDHVDFCGVNDGGNARKHLFLEGFFHRVDEGDLFVENEIGVVSRAFFRFVAVEVAQIPVDGAYPVDALCDANGVHVCVFSFQ